MNSTAEKILLLAVMLALTALGGGFGMAETRETAIVSKNSSNLVEQPRFQGPLPEPPIFVLSAPAIDVPTTSMGQNAPSDTEAGDVQDIVLADEKDQVPGLLSAHSSAADSKASGIPSAARDSGMLVSEQTMNPAAFRPATTVVEPSVNAEAALVADLQSGEVYFARNADKRWPIASITKLMTALIAWDAIPKTDAITLMPEDFPKEDTTVSKHLKVGDVLTADDLLSSMLIVSSNEAAQALAGHAGLDDFVAKMNRTASDLGMGDTYFADPTGLSSSDQSTALDLRKLAVAVYEKHPEILRITKKRKLTVLDAGSKKKLSFDNINLFAGESWFVGGKTGYTDDAGGNLLTVFSHSGRPVLAVVLGTEDRFGESEKLVNWFTQSYRISSKQ